MVAFTFQGFHPVKRDFHRDDQTNHWQQYLQHRFHLLPSACAVGVRCPPCPGGVGCPRPQDDYDIICLIWQSVSLIQQNNAVADGQSAATVMTIESICAKITGQGVYDITSA